jgi:hypothetical protein
MSSNALRTIRRQLALAAAITLCAACADSAPVAPINDRASATPASAKSSRAEAERAIATLRRVTARYHNLNAALDDGFVFLHACEVRPGEGGVGALYVHFERLLDGVLDPRSPDALVYEPARNGRERPKLVAAELAIPYALWKGADPPTFLGAEFQREDEFGVYGLHVWIWRHNPEGMFAEGNPRVSCGEVS